MKMAFSIAICPSRSPQYDLGTPVRIFHLTNCFLPVSSPHDELRNYICNIPYDMTQSLEF